MTAPTVIQSGTFQTIVTHDAWVWRCEARRPRPGRPLEDEACGWLGVSLPSERAALGEASTHYWTQHEIALCASIDGQIQFGHPGHRWKEVRGTDAIEQCERCGETIGK